MNKCLEFIVPKMLRHEIYNIFFSLILYSNFSDKFLKLDSNQLSVHAHILGGIGKITVNLQAFPVSLAASIKVALVSSSVPGTLSCSAAALAWSEGRPDSQ